MTNTVTDEQQAFEVIKKFNHLNASRASMTDFLDIIDPDRLVIMIRNTDIRFEGIAGFSDHQMGKLIFFDQKFDCELINSTVNDNEITISTKGVWYASCWQTPAAYSQNLIADLKHTWILERENNKKPYRITTHICEEFGYRKGYAPTDETKDFHLNLK